MQLKCLIRRGALVISILALISITAVGQENRSEISIQGTGFFCEGHPEAAAHSNAPARPADFCLAIVTTSIAGSRLRRTMATTATHNSISAAQQPASSPISTKSLAPR